MAVVSKTRTARDIVFYAPNLIGYARVALALSSFGLMIISSATTGSLWKISMVLYLLAFTGDLFDGIVARKLNQTSGYGGVLDMITDRCSTLGFLYVLSGDYAPIDQQIGFPAYRLLFLCLILLDVSSHWVQMHSTLSTGQHHKSETGNKGRHFLVRWFYKYYNFFAYLCVGAELTYIALYARLHLLREEEESPEGWLKLCNAILFVAVPGCILKQFVNLSQLTSAFMSIAQQDAAFYNSKKSLE